MQWLRKKVLNPVLDQLKQGADPRRLAWSVSLGFAVGIFPVLGTTLILCLIIATVFKLNHVAIQAANYVAYPGQLAFIPAFIRMGEKISGAEPMTIDLHQMKNLFMSSPSGFFAQFGMAAVHGALAWAVILPIPTFVLALVLERQFRRVRGGTSSP
jgi:hypothetical protein